MRKETIWNLEDILDYHKNLKLDLEIDLRNTEFTEEMKKELRKKIKLTSDKIKELKGCIKWLNKNEN